MTNALVVVQPIDQFIDFTVGEVAVSSARVYRQTFKLWTDWCAENEVNALDLRPANVVPFLTSRDVAKTTRQRQLSALRHLARMIYLLAPSDGTKLISEALKDIKAPTTTYVGKERTKHALTPGQADKVLHVWTQPANRHRRNQALIAVLALGALRRSEAADLQWRDVDFENGVITVRHGKGDKLREVPLAGNMALDALRAWQMGIDAGRTFIFCAVGRYDVIGADQPISGTDVYRIVDETETLSGVEFKPHDLRRTYITEALATGTPLATVQAAAGHARGETTLRYAQAVDARTARKTLRFRYGSEL